MGECYDPGHDFVLLLLTAPEGGVVCSVLV